MVMRTRMGTMIRAQTTPINDSHVRHATGEAWPRRKVADGGNRRQRERAALDRGRGSQHALGLGRMHQGLYARRAPGNSCK